MAHHLARQELAPEIAGVVDPVWMRIRQEAEAALRAEPALATLLFTTILNQPTLEAAVIHRVASRLAHAALTSDLIIQTFEEALAGNSAIAEAFRADILAVVDRDPACSRFLEPLLYFKGFHAIQTHRLANWLWTEGRRDFALSLQSRSSEVFQTDINPAARIG